MEINNCEWSFVIHPDEQLQIINKTYEKDYWIDLDNYEYDYEEDTIEGFVYDRIQDIIEWIEGF